jgi:hypothetical protein
MQNNNNNNNNVSAASKNTVEKSTENTSPTQKGLSKS